MRSNQEEYGLSKPEAGVQVNEKNQEKEKQHLCPFPQDEVYTNIRSNLSREQQDIMKENISIAKDGVVVINKLGKGTRVFLLTISKPDHKNTFEWSYKDQYGKTWVEWVDYLTGKMIEQEMASQWKYFLTDIEPDWTRKPQKDSKLIKERTNAIINFFPWETMEDKRIIFAKLLRLYEKKPGYWDPNYRKWNFVGSFGYAKLSRVDEGDNICWVGWNDHNANIVRNYQKFPYPFVACEHC